MKNYFKLPNTILFTDLTANEFAVLAYLVSIYSNIRSTSGHEYIRVRQATIAGKCGIKCAQTVSRITASLMRKGYISHILAAYRADGLQGTYTYVLSPEALKSEYYTKIKRNVFDYGFSAMQLKVYCLVAKCIDPKLGYMHNSFGDMAKYLGIKRSKVIEIINQLVEMRKIHKLRKKRKDNPKVYADNRYSLKKIRLIKRGIKKLQPCFRRGCNKTILAKTYPSSFIAHLNHNTALLFCQYISKIFIPIRGSPQNLRSIYKPDYFVIKTHNC